MKRPSISMTLWFALFCLLTSHFASPIFAEDAAIPAGADPNAVAGEDAYKAAEEPAAEEAPKPKKAEKKQKVERADAFVAGADWEFDGFVAGGQDQDVRTMFYQGDLVYLNIGSQQGVATGDLLVIYKRGKRIKDPQSGKFIGFEVRRAAYGRVTDRVDSNTTSVRIEKTVEPVELGDLVRRE